MTDDRICNCSSHQQPRCVHWRMGNCPDKPMPAGVAIFPIKMGNGAREAMISCLGDDFTADEADYLMVLLWDKGFKIVPLADADR